MVNSITKDKCNVCCRKVQKRHKAIQCDICQNWVHIKCNFLDEKTYKKLQTSSDPWYCLTCLKSILPFSTITNENLYVTQKGLTLNPISTMNTPNESALNMMSSLNIFSDQESQDEDITPCKYYEPIELNGLKQSKHKHHLNTLHLNIQSIFSHVDDLQRLLTLSNDIKFDIIGLTETRLKNVKLHSHPQILMGIHQNLVQQNQQLVVHYYIFQTN